MKVKISFEEQSKCVVANVSIEDDTTAEEFEMEAQNNHVLEETKRLYLKAQLFAAEQTMRKIGIPK